VRGAAADSSAPVAMRNPFSMGDRTTE
jgi:hypothetical protein